MSVFDFMGSAQPVLEFAAKRVNVFVNQRQRMRCGICAQLIINSVPDVGAIKGGYEDIEHRIEIKHLIQRSIFFALVD